MGAAPPLIFKDKIEYFDDLHGLSERMNDEANSEISKLAREAIPSCDQCLQLCEKEQNNYRNDACSEVEFPESTFGDKVYRRETIHEVSGILPPD